MIFDMEKTVFRAAVCGILRVAHDKKHQLPATLVLVVDEQV